MNKYETRLLRVLRSLQDDYAHNRITEKEFEILVGLLIEKEFSDNIKHQIHHVLPKQHRKKRGFSFINYELKHTHGG